MGYCPRVLLQMREMDWAKEATNLADVLANQKFYERVLPEKEKQEEGL